jgi:hypothetical protein
MGSSESNLRGGVTQLFIVTAALELGAGLMLLVAPAMFLRLLFGSAVDVVPAVGTVRLAGVALLSLGAACLWARDDDRSGASRAIVRAMLIYNGALTALVLFGGLGSLGPFQWGAVVVHGAMGTWCALVLADRHR